MKMNRLNCHICVILFHAMKILTCGKCSVLYAKLLCLHHTFISLHCNISNIKIYMYTRKIISVKHANLP